MKKDYQELKEVIQKANLGIETQITIADVLIASMKQNKGNHLSVNEAGMLGYYNGEKMKWTKNNWNLKDDNLDNQSDKTKQFLINLLVK